MNLRLKKLYTLYSVQELAEHCLHEESENKILNNRINKAIELVNEMLERAYINGEYILYDYSTSEILEIKEALNGGDEE